jgi:hypothetical protein
MEISSLTVAENIKISATFIYLTEDKFGCDNKLIEYTKREGEERAKKRLQKENGCGVIKEKHRYEIDGIRYHQCVCGYRNYDLGFYIQLQDNFEKGILPFEGSYMDQPAQIIEIIDRISQLRLDKQERDYKKSLSEKKNG